MFGLLELFLLIAIIGFALKEAEKKKKRERPEIRYKYKKKPLLTDNEVEFFNRIVKAVPESYVFCQTSMGGIIDGANFDPRDRIASFMKIAAKRLDFLVCDKNLNIIAVIELDDRSHIGRRRKDAERDAILSGAGIKTIRYESRNRPSVETIRIDLAIAKHF